MLIGDGVVSDLSSRGIGIRGNQLVAPGATITSLSTFLEWKSLFALPRAEFPGLKDGDWGGDGGPDVGGEELLAIPPVSSCKPSQAVSSATEASRN